MARYTDSQRSVLTALSALTVVVVVAVGILALTRVGNDSPSTTTSAVPTTLTAPTTVATSRTITTVTTTTLATSTTLGQEALVMSPTALGPLPLGAEIGPVLELLTTVLGNPDEDTDWIAVGNCPGTRMRAVRWQSLQVMFSDGPTEWAPAGTDHLFSYTNSSLLAEPLPLRTDLGVSVGSTVADLLDAYGAAVTVVDDEIYGPLFVVDPPEAAYLWGFLDGIGEGNRILAIIGGQGCGE